MPATPAISGTTARTPGVKRARRMLVLPCRSRNAAAREELRPPSQRAPPRRERVAVAVAEPEGEAIAHDRPDARRQEDGPEVDGAAWHQGGDRDDDGRAGNEGADDG